MKRKEVDDVLGGDEMWKHADSTDGEWYLQVGLLEFACLTVLLGLSSFM